MNTSFRAIKGNKINKSWRHNICAKMRAGKERKKLEKPIPERPPDMSENWTSLVFTRCINGQKQTVELFGDALDWNTYMVWNPATKEKQGNMTVRQMLLCVTKHFLRVSIKQNL